MAGEADVARASKKLSKRQLRMMEYEERKVGSESIKRIKEGETRWEVEQECMSTKEERIAAKKEQKREKMRRKRGEKGRPGVWDGGSSKR